jgi:hypothetical protein
LYTTEEATSLFVEIIFARVYQNIYRDMVTKILPEGLPGRVDDPISLQEWLNSLDANHLNYINEIVQSTIEESIIRFLGVLDNQIGYPNI